MSAAQGHPLSHDCVDYMVSHLGALKKSFEIQEHVSSVGCSGRDLENAKTSAIPDRSSPDRSDRDSSSWLSYHEIMHFEDFTHACLRTRIVRRLSFMNLQSNFTSWRVNSNAAREWRNGGLDNDRSNNGSSVACRTYNSSYSGCRVFLACSGS